LENNDLPMKEVLAEAINYVKAETIWKIGMCYQYGERILKSNFGNLFFEHLRDYLLESSLFRIKFQKPRKCTILFKNGVWKPMKLIWATEIMICGSVPSNWPYVEDNGQTKIIESVCAKMQLFRRNKYFVLGHFKVL
jgi:hypothetical protein